tara:strand:+ start:10396 stop:10707 length:312 start_codon:yes stop_codon:yes gene_type:complete
MKLKEIDTKEILPGLNGRMVHGEKITWAFWEIEKGAEVPMHQHIHEQIMHVQEGEFEFTLDGKTKNYGSNSVVVIPSNIPHSGIALTDCKIMDVFSPVREEYR